MLMGICNKCGQNFSNIVKHNLDCNYCKDCDQIYSSSYNHYIQCKNCKESVCRESFTWCDYDTKFDRHGYCADCVDEFITLMMYGCVEIV